MCAQSGVRLTMVAGLVFTVACAQAARSPDQPTPEDKPYSGTIDLVVDLTDVRHRVFRVHESLPAKPGTLVLLYPKWIPGEHGPTGPLEGIAGLKITAGGQRISWRRDLEDMFALNVQVPPGVDRVDMEFQYLSPTTAVPGGPRVCVTDNLVQLEWNDVVLYPAGFYSRQIMVQPSVTLPDAWSFASALEPVGAGGPAARFKPVDLETLVDSPVMAGRYFKRLDIGPVSPPVYLDLVADRPENLAASPEQLKQHEALVREAYALFGARHYRHYDFLLTLSDHTPRGGLEHHQSSNNRNFPDFFTSPEHYQVGSGLLPHEYVHSWNGKFRRPAGLLTPNFNVTGQDDLLWVYEGLTTYYGEVLTARSGMLNPQQFRDRMAVLASRMSHVPGRSWRPLQDTADAAPVLYRAPGAWRNWRRGADFYEEGLLLWLDVDTTIREASGGARSLDDFARAFFGVDDTHFVPLPYSFDDLVAALNQVQKHDWRAFLSKRLQATDEAAPLDGLTRAGWKLVYSEEPSAYSKALERVARMVDLTSSLGLVIGDPFDTGQMNTVTDVLWSGPAFEAGVAPGMKLIAVDQDKFKADVLKDAIKSAKAGTRPIELLVEHSGTFVTLKLDYHGGVNYPHLERIENTEDRLSAISHARAN
ncbi:MAG TPA: peptidase M61 [Burkholderiaceae bacterium]|nr:peptidase M61 [Burkholderiaceae bacterium]